MIGKSTIHNVKSFNAIGFDLDHTVLKYRLRNFTKLIYESSAQSLITRKNYPTDLFPKNEEEAKSIFRMYFRAILDHKTGNLLKIDSNCSVMRGFNGFKSLSDQEIKGLYGPLHQLSPNVVKNYKSKDWTYFHDFYGAGVVPLMAKIIQLKSEKSHDFLNKKSVFEIVNDLVLATEFNYIINDFEKFKINQYDGFWYPKILADPLLYVNKTGPVLLERLINLRKSGKVVFIITNNYYEASNKVLNLVIGKNWKDYFDFMIFNAEKPHFFHKKDESLKISGFQNLKGENITDFEAFFLKDKQGDDKVLKGGHADIISDFLKKRFGENYKTAYFGDSIYSDCVYSFNGSINPNWSCFLILEELQELELGYPDSEYYNYCSYWGSALHDKSMVSGVDKTYIFHVADKIAHRAFSSIESKEALQFLDVS